MKQLFFILITTSIVFFIYVGMAYVTKMPVDKNILENNDDNEITYIAPAENKPKSLLKPATNKHSLNIKPNNETSPKTLDVPNFSGVNSNESKLSRQDMQNLFSQTPAITGEDFTQIDPTSLDSLLSEPLYPYDAYQNKVNGWVLLKLYISKVGKVTNVDVLDSSPKGVFETFAVKAAYKKEFPIDQSILDPKAFTKNILTKYDAGS